MAAAAPHNPPCAAQPLLTRLYCHIADLPPVLPLQVRGATTHYDAVVGGATSGVLNASTDSGVPVIFGVLTCDTMEQVGWAERVWGRFGAQGLGQGWLGCERSSSLLDAALQLCSGELAPQRLPPIPACVGAWSQLWAPLLASIQPNYLLLAPACRRLTARAATAIEMGNLMRSLRAAGNAAEPW